MGYRRNPKTLKLTFDGGEMAGLEVSVRRASTATMRHIVTVAEGAQSGTLEERARRVLDLCDAFGALIYEWNLEDEQGNPLPATAEVLAQEDASFTIALAYGWIDAMAERAQQLLAQSGRDEEVEAALPVSSLE
jgi:hypothetical protein